MLLARRTFLAARPACLPASTCDKDTPPGLQGNGAGLFAVNIDGSGSHQPVRLAHHLITDGDAHFFQ
jgi:hypothetical protein